VLLGDSIVDSLYAPVLGERKTWNAAVAGVGARYYAEHAQVLLEKARPAIVVVALGINDCSRRPYESLEDTSQWLHLYKSIISAIRSVDAVPVLVTILPVEDNRPLGSAYFSQTMIRTLNECIRHLAEEEELVLIDAYARFAANGTMPVGATVDGVHLTTHSSMMLKGELERGVATAEAQIKNKKRRKSP
jgi:lysophospholipase L1-like esterase